MDIPLPIRLSAISGKSILRYCGLLASFLTLLVLTSSFTIPVTKNQVPANTLDKLGLTSSTQAAGSFSLRLLTNDYTGPLVRIAVGSSFYDVYPDASADHVFSLTSPVSAAYSSYNASLTGATGTSLNTVIGSNSATVSTWYDQSGNGRDGIQGTSSRQPQIINAGTIITANGKPTLKFMGGQWLVVTTNAFNMDLSGSCVYNATSANTSAGGANGWYNMNGIVGSEQPSNTTDFGYGVYNGKFTAGFGVNDNSVGSNTTVTDGVTRISSWTRTNSSGSVSLYNNGSSDGNATLPANVRSAVPSVAIGAATTNGSTFFNGTISEIALFPIVYNSTEIHAIEASQSTYYSISVLQAQINTSGNLSALTTTRGTASASTSFNVAGNALSGSILVTSPTGFEVSLNNSSFSPTVTVGSGGTFGSVAVYIRLSASASYGTYSGNIVLTSTGANTVTVPTVASTITPQASDFPAISYGAPKVLGVNMAIAPITPTATNVGAFGYGSGVNFGSTFLQIGSIKIDKQGNTYMLDLGSYELFKYAPNSTTGVKVELGETYPSAITIDDADNLYLADAGYGVIKKIQGGTGAISTIGSGISYVYNMTIAKDGTIYMADGGSGTIKKLLQGSSTAVDIGIAFDNATDVVVDVDGNLYVADQNNMAVKKIWLSSDSHIETVYSGSQVISLAFDKAGNLFAGDPQYSRILEIPADGSSVKIIASGSSYQYPGGLYVNDKGLIFVSTYDANAKVVTPTGGYFISSSLPKGLSFDQNTGIISGTPTALSAAENYTITAYNSIGGMPAIVSIAVKSGNANLSALTVTGATINPVFDAGTITYTSTVASTVASVNITPTVADADATITYNGSPVTSGAAVTVSLSGGSNSIPLIVTSAAGATKTYTITITKTVAPTLSYGTAQTFAVNTAITPVAPTTANVAAFGYGSPVPFANGFYNVKHFIKDSQGNYYILDGATYKVYKYPAGGGPRVDVQTRESGTGYPFTIAIDSADNLYVSDIDNGDLVKIAAGTGTFTTLATGLNYVYDIAIDKDGSLFVADASAKQVKKIPAGGGTPVVVGTGFDVPTNIAIDAAGDVYVSDQSGLKVFKIWMSTDQHKEELSTSVRQPGGLSIDKANNLYIADISNLRVFEYPADGSGERILASGNNYSGLRGVQVYDQGVINIARSEASDILTPTGGYFIDGVLPKGLSFDQTTGIISGTPTKTSPATQYKITAYNGVESVTNTITIDVKSGNADLSALTVTGATLSPIFDSGTISYSSSVLSSVASVDITPTVADAGATITYNGSPVTSGAAVTVSLSGGSNSIPLIVTSAAGATKTYTITITKTVAPTLSYGTAQTFAVNTAITPVAPTTANVAAFGYGSPVPFANGFYNVKHFIKDSQGNYYILDGATYKVYKYPAGGGPRVDVQTRESGTGYPFTIAIDSADNLYVSDIDNGDLVKIAAGTGTFTTLATGLNYVYDIAIDKDGSLFVADASAKQVKKIPAGGGTPVVVGTGFDVPTNIAIDAAGDVYVSDQSGLKVFKIWMSTDQHKEELSTSVRQPGGLSIDKANNLYIADISNLRVFEYPADGSGERILASGNNYSGLRGVQVYDQGMINIARSEASDILTPTGGYFIDGVLPKGLSFDQTTGIISGTPTKTSPATQYKITAYNGVESVTNTITIGVESDLDLSNLLTDAGSLTPMFDADSTSYKVTVNSGTTSADITATLSEGSNSLTINGIAATSGVTAGIALNAGDNIVPVVVTSPIDNSTKTYTVIIHRISNDYKLHNLTVSTSSLSPSFDADVFGYTVDLPYGTTSAKLTPTINAFASVKVDEVTTASGTESQSLSLQAGDNNINVHVIAEDGTSTATYIVNLRVAGPSSVSLSDLTLSAGTLNPAFSAGNTNYQVSVPVGTSTIAVHPVVADALSVATVNGSVLDGASGSVNVPLNDGLNTIAVSVLANDGTTTNSYTITVNKLIPAPTSAILAAQVYNTGTAITPLSTGFSHVAAPGYFAQSDTLSYAVPTPTGIAVNSTGDLFIADITAGAIYKIPAGGGAPVAILSGLNTPLGVATDAAGNVYAAALGNNNIKKITPDGTITSLGSGLSFPTGLTVDAAGNIYVDETANHAVKKITPAGITTTLTTALSFPYGITVDANYIYVADNSAGTIQRFNLSGGAKTTLISGLVNPTDVKVDAIGNVYVAEGGNNLVTRYDKNGANPVQISSGYTGLFGIAIGKAGYLYTTDNGKQRIEKLTPSGGYYLNDLLPDGLVFDTATGIISGTPTTVTAAKNYSITAYNSGGGTTSVVNIQVAADVMLANLEVSGTTLTPVFDSRTINYNSSVGVDVSFVMVTPTAIDADATISVNGTAVLSGAASQNILLNPGDNAITVIITAANGVTFKKYTLTVNREKASDAGLTTFVINQPYKLVRVDDNFTVSVPAILNSITIKPILSDSNATVKVNGVIVANGSASGLIALNANPTIVNVEVVAADGVTTKTYIIAVNHFGSNVATLTKLITDQPSGLVLVSNSNSLTSYSLAVSSTATQVRITPVLKDPNASMTINGVPSASNVLSAPIPLNANPTIITTIVTAEDGVTTKTYSITVNKTGNSIADLTKLTTDQSSGLVLVSNTLSQISYSLSVSNTATQVRITPVLKDVNASITINGVPSASNVLSAPILLNANPTIITTVVTAEDGVTTKTYSITVNKTGNSIADLTKLTTDQPSGLVLVSNSKLLVNYSLAVSGTATQIRITPVLKDVNASITINGVPSASNVLSAPIPLNTNPTIITTVVTAEDGVTTKTYSITVNKTGNTTADLTKLITDQPAGLVLVSNTPSQVSYSLAVSAGTTQIRITPVLKDVNASISINGVPSASNVQSAPISVTPGATTITTVVTAEDGITTKTYSIEVNRPSGILLVDRNDSKLLFANNTANNVAPTGDDGVVVHQGVSPNGDGSNDFLYIEGISAYAGNKLSIMNTSGALVFETKDYGKDSSHTFDGHSNKNGALLKPGTYFYALEYQVGKESKRKTGYIIIKY